MTVSKDSKTHKLTQNQLTEQFETYFNLIETDKRRDERGAYAVKGIRTLWNNWYSCAKLNGVLMSPEEENDLYDQMRGKEKTKEITCQSCGQQVRTWKVENRSYPIKYTDGLGIDHHETDSVLMCLNPECIEHGEVYKYIEGLNIDFDINIPV